MASQKLGRELRDAGSNGIAFDSVRRDGGECVAIFRPRLVQNVRQSVHLRYAWDGDVHRQCLRDAGHEPLGHAAAILRAGQKDTR